MSHFVLAFGGCTSLLRDISSKNNSGAAQIGIPIFPPVYVHDKLAKPPNMTERPKSLSKALPLSSIRTLRFGKTIIKIFILMHQAYCRQVSMDYRMPMNCRLGPVRWFKGYAGNWTHDIPALQQCLLPVKIGKGMLYQERRNPTERRRCEGVSTSFLSSMYFSSDPFSIHRETIALISPMPVIVPNSETMFW